jgi:hypothetical protein
MSFHPFSESVNAFLIIRPNDEDPVYERTFEQLITERGDFTIRNVNENYEDIFNKIKNRLFFLNTETVYKEKPEYKEKYKTEEFYKLLKDIKKEIVFVYNKKVELEISINEKKKEYLSFCEHVTDIVNLVNCSFDEQDDSFKNVLNEKLDQYYEKLNLEDLTEQLNETNNEFEYIKKIMYTLCNISPQICAVCLENQVTHFYSECGHTICLDCKDKYSSKICHYCRSPIKKVFRFYQN